MIGVDTPDTVKVFPAALPEAEICVKVTDDLLGLVTVKVCVVELPAGIRPKLSDRGFATSALLVAPLPLTESVRLGFDAVLLKTNDPVEAWLDAGENTTWKVTLCCAPSLNGNQIPFSE